MKVGAEPKKLAILGVLAAVAAVVLYTNSSPDGVPRRAAPASPPAVRAAAPAAIPGGTQAILERPVSARAGRLTDDRASSQFRPSLKPRRPEDRADPMTIDPTLRLDLLAKLQDVKLEGGGRSLFEFSQPKPPKTPDVKILPKPGNAKPGPGPENAGPEKPPAPAVKPAPPPIRLKFYGYISPVKQGAKRAFFLDGEEIIVAAEGELIQRRYKVVRIGVNSVVVEDTEHKHQQTLALEERAG